MKKQTVLPQLLNSILQTVLLTYIVWLLVGLVEIKTNVTNNYFYNTVETPKVRDMRITAYTPTSNKTALGENMVVGRTAAISPNCLELLGERVYIKGHGVRYINDIAASWLDTEFNMCTLDLAVPTKKDAIRIGNNTSKVVVIRYNDK